ncbi:MAG: hypothetical protein ABH825_02825 [Candidatus Omnitrophota bacterium]
MQTKQITTQKTIIPIRGYLLHLTHYDPGWCMRKRSENPIDLDLALEIISAVAQDNFNLLIVDCEDGLIYRTHPELARRYSITRKTLKKLLNHARKQKIEVVPKLNFSQSRYHKHNRWFRPYNGLTDSEKYWKIAFELIDELIEIFRPARFFHIGMDEDDKRTYEQYISAILTLRNGLKKRGLRPIVWNDTAMGGSRPWHARKSLAAEKQIPKDVVQALWDYRNVRPETLQRIIKEGFDVWVAPSQNPMQILRWKQLLLRYGGKGLIMTSWIPCRPRNRLKLLTPIYTVGPIYSTPFKPIKLI